jgi:ATP-dependent Clp protease ATP-binding subunit ClpA
VRTRDRPPWEPHDKEPSITDPDVHESPLTPRMAQILRAAERHVDGAVSRSVGTEHVLLALIEDKDGVAGRVLDELGFADAVHKRVREVIESPAYRTVHVLELDEQKRVVDDHRTNATE